MLPAALVLGLWLYWGQNQGGYFPREWYPSAVFAVALAVVTALATGRVIPVRREVRVPLLLFAAFVGWSYLSALWSSSPGGAWDAANKLLLYLACAWVLALLPWTARRAYALLGAWSIGLAAIAAFSLLGAIGSEDFSGYLFESRYQDPVGYANGNAALAVSGVWPALMLASRRGASTASSGLFLALAALLLEFAMLSQSRGSLVGAVVALAAFVALAPDRLRIVARLLPLGLAVALAVGPILDVYEVGSAGGSLAQAIDDAVMRIALSVMVAGALGALVAVGGRLLDDRPRVRTASRRAAVALAAVLALVALVAVAGSADSIANRVDEEISTITSDEYVSPSRGRTRASSLDPYERPDYWRVAIDLFAESPLVGSGAGSFEHEYTARRRVPKHSRFAHNIYLRILGEEGLIGALLLLGFLGAAVVLAVVQRRRVGPGPAGVLAASVAVLAYVFAHAGLDWLEEVPAVVAPAFALPLMALVAAGNGMHRTLPRSGRTGAVIGAFATTAALVSLVPPWLSVRYLDRAERVAPARPEAAFTDLGRAHTLNPLSLTPLLTEARLAIEVGRDARARRALNDAASIEDNWYSHFQLALLAAERGRFAVAERQIARARELSASDPVLGRYERLIAARRRLDPEAVNQELATRSSTRFTSPR